MKKRTTFETTLVRRVAKKADFLRYITYEMGLEQLRRKRVARLSPFISFEGVRSMRVTQAAVFVLLFLD